jgi:phage-related protein
MVGAPSPPDVVFEGDSRAIIKSFPDDVREDIGADLWRVQNGEQPLDSKSMAPVLPKVFELRADDRDAWYRVLCIKLDSVVYVLHCFRKKTNQTPAREIEIARRRLSVLKQRLGAGKKHN